MTFFESILYFAPIVSHALPWRVPVLGIWRKRLYLNHCRCIPNVSSTVFTSLPANPESITAGLDPPHYVYLPTAPPLPTVEMNNFAPSNLNLSIAHRKGKRYCAQHSIFNFISYDRLTPLSRQFVLFVSSISIPKSYQKVLIMEASHG